MKITVLDAGTLGEDIDLSVVTDWGDAEVFEKTAEDEVSQRIKDTEVIVLNKVKLNEENLKGASKLKLICITATGFDNVDVEYCRKNGIAVCNVCGYSTDSVAQLTVLTALALVMHLGEYDGFVKSGEYTKSGMHNRLSPAFHEVSSMTWGIVGYGNIGKKVALSAKALGANVLAYKRTPVADVECVDLDTLCEKSDIITVHLPLSEDTREIIGERQIELMKKSAVVVNMARGAVIDEKAFAKAVKNERIAGFATDVYSVEPMEKDSPYQEILNCKNVIFTPHMAWGAYEARMRCLEEICKNIKAFYSGERRNRVD